MKADEIVLTMMRALAAVGVPHMTVGALAGIYYGIGRTTNDADFVIQADDLRLTPLRQALGPKFVIDPQPRIETVTWSTYYYVAVAESDFGIELFMLRDDPHDQLAFSRRRIVRFEGGEAPICSPEDYVITKLRWGKTKQRPKDIEDVRAVLTVQQGKLDLAFIRQWSDQHETRQLFEEILARVPRLPE
jgi:hypothetical protein